MRSIEFLEQPVESAETYASFIVFEPASQRIVPQDVLLKGDEVVELFERVVSQFGWSEDLKQQIVYNRLNRLNMMLDLVKNSDNILLTKFVNKVWRRYGFFSNLGEYFLDMDDFTTHIPEYKGKEQSLYLQKFSGGGDDDDESDSSDTTDDTSSSTADTDSK